MTRSAAGPPQGGGGRRQLTYDVRIWKTRIIKGAFGRAYQVRWIVGGKVRYATFGNKALADSHESKIRTASREGEAFDPEHPDRRVRDLRHAEALQAREHLRDDESRHHHQHRP